MTLPLLVRYYEGEAAGIPFRTAAVGRWKGASAVAVAVVMGVRMML